MSVNLKEMLVFSHPGRVDWVKTDAKVAKALVEMYPDARPSELALSHAATMKSIRKDVRKWGSMNVWATIEAAKKQEEAEKPKPKEIHGVLRINLADVSNG